MCNALVILPLKQHHWIRTWASVGRHRSHKPPTGRQTERPCRQRDCSPRNAARRLCADKSRRVTARNASPRRETPLDAASQPLGARATQRLRYASLCTQQDPRSPPQCVETPIRPLDGAGSTTVRLAPRSIPTSGLCSDQRTALLI